MVLAFNRLPPLMTERPALSIVVPLFRSASTLKPLVDQLEALAVPGGHELVLVHDGSPDDTLEVARRVLTAPRRVPVTLVDLARNFGEHNAVLAGLRHARGRWVVTMDDDLQNPPHEVLALLRAAEAGGHDVVYGHYRAKEHAVWRNWGSAFCNAVAGWVLDKPPGLYLSSFRCLSAFIVAEVVRYEGPFPYVDGLILQATNRIASIPVEHRARVAGESGYTLRKLVRLWLSMFVNFSVVPLRFATWLGLAMGAAGLGGVAWVAWLWWEGVGPAFGWGSIMTAVLILGGVQLVMIGLVGEYVGRTYLSLNARPQAVVRSAKRFEPSGAVEEGGAAGGRG
jgi:glycosyltransferase involved in cell wall biosynthesis